jgi:hypothetical protein
MNKKMFEFSTVILIFACIAVSLTIGLILQVVNGYVDGNNNGKDDVREYYDSIPKNSYYYSYPPNRQNLTETSCMSNTVVWIHNGICYAEDPEGILK